MNETITFDIGLSTVGNPVLHFYLDDIPMPGPVFEHKCTWGAHTLKIAHSGKTNHTPDQFVKIDSVIIDGVNIGQSENFEIDACFGFSEPPKWPSSVVLKSYID